MDPLVGGVGGLDHRAEGDHVHAGDLLADDAAFEPGVDRLDLRFRSDFALVDLPDDVEERRPQVRLPARIGGAQVHLGAGQLARRADAAAQGVERRVHRRPRAGGDDERAVRALDRGDVVARLHQVRDVAAHRLDAVRKAGDQPQHGRRGPGVPGLVRGGRGADGQRHAGVGGPVLVPDRFELGAHGRRHAPDVGRPGDEGRERLARNGVVGAAPVEPRETERRRGVRRPQGARQQADRVAALQVDVAAGMAALESGQRHRHRAVPASGRGRRHAERKPHVAAARAADVQDAFLLGVEVDQPASGQEAGVEPRRPGESRLLVDREQQLQRPVDQIGRFQHREHRRDADPVVRAERGAGGVQMVSFPPRDDGVGGEVERDVGVLLLHHVQVRLQDGDRGGLAPGGGRLAHHDVAGAVHRVAAAGAGRGVDDVPAHPLLVLRGARNGQDGVEVAPDRLRFEG